MNKLQYSGYLFRGNHFYAIAIHHIVTLNMLHNLLLEILLMGIYTRIQMRGGFYKNTYKKIEFTDWNIMQQMNIMNLLILLSVCAWGLSSTNLVVRNYEILQSVDHLNELLIFLYRPLCLWENKSFNLVLLIETGYNFVSFLIPI